MNHCKQCGTELPDGARFCLHCGTPVVPPENIRPAEPQAELEFLQPALAGGMFLGLLSSLPLIAAGNCFCCMWVLGGGAITTFLLTKQRPAGISYGDGAFGGVLAGVAGAVVATIVGTALKVLSAQFFQSQQEMMEKMMADMPEMEGPMKDLMMRIFSPEISALSIGITFFMNLVAFSLVAMIGGILMVAILNKKGAGVTPRPQA